MSLVKKAERLLKNHSPEYVIQKLTQNKMNKKSEVIKAVNQAQLLK